ncbi:hypothetical protein Ancab_008719 [Ancistrocladus abbreviatus]
MINLSENDLAMKVDEFFNKDGDWDLLKHHTVVPAVSRIFPVPFPHPKIVEKTCWCRDQKTMTFSPSNQHMRQSLATSGITKAAYGIGFGNEAECTLHALRDCPKVRRFGWSSFPHDDAFCSSTTPCMNGCSPISQRGRSGLKAVPGLWFWDHGQTYVALAELLDLQK